MSATSASRKMKTTEYMGGTWGYETDKPKWRNTSVGGKNAPRKRKTTQYMGGTWGYETDKPEWRYTALGELRKIENKVQDLLTDMDIPEASRERSLQEILDETKKMIEQLTTT